ncbi:ABC transporter permease [Staphylospora marina]|uniref:ABC transporter permease n=1 Tax=Staphylospora marina TaxID=2490858 RepID=UPI000F5BCCEA|nr:DUF2705 family protein [Staphylospora marina]
MTEFIRLLQNENMKLFNRTSMIFLLGLLPFGTLVLGLFHKFVSVHSAYKPSMWDFMTEAVHLLFVVKLITIVVASRSLAEEFRFGTIKLLLIRPVSRTRLLAAKYVHVLLLILFCLLFLVVLSMLFGAVFFTVGSPDDRVLEALDTTWSVYGLSALETFILATLSFMLSCVTRSGSMAMFIVLVVMVMGPISVELMKLLGLEFLKYLFFAHLDLKPYLTDTQMPGMSPALSGVVLTLHALLFLGLAWYSFAKRDVSV